MALYCHYNFTDTVTATSTEQNLRYYVHGLNYNIKKADLNLSFQAHNVFAVCQANNAVPSDK